MTDHIISIDDNVYKVSANTSGIVISGNSGVYRFDSEIKGQQLERLISGLDKAHGLTYSASVGTDNIQLIIKHSMFDTHDEYNIKLDTTDYSDYSILDRRITSIASDTIFQTIFITSDKLGPNVESKYMVPSLSIIKEYFDPKINKTIFIKDDKFKFIFENLNVYFDFKYVLADNIIESENVITFPGILDCLGKIIQDNHIKTIITRKSPRDTMGYIQYNSKEIHGYLYCKLKKWKPLVEEVKEGWDTYQTDTEDYKTHAWIMEVNLPDGIYMSRRTISTSGHIIVIQNKKMYVKWIYDNEIHTYDRLGISFNSHTYGVYTRQ